MKTTAIICEFNPLHTGHKKLIDYAKTFSDKVICIMSGNFTQRGLPACAEKHQRATHAIKAGADLVVELPSVFAVSSAENFALGGIAVADKLNVDYLLFGSECGSLSDLTQCAQMLDDKETNEKIRDELAKGAAYPKAVAQAINSDVINYPNNTLALEYLRSLKRINSKITPVTLKRENDYNSVKAKEYASSAALRADSSLRENYTFDFVCKDINDSVEDKFKNYAAIAISQIEKEAWKNIEGVSEGIENRFITAEKHNGYEALMEAVKTKRFTRARLQRIVLSAVLKITKECAQIAKNNLSNINVTPLAVSKNSLELLQLTQKNVDEITQRADDLYKAISGINPPTKLIKI